MNAIEMARSNPRVVLGLLIAVLAAVEYRSTLYHVIRERWSPDRSRLWWLVKYGLIVAGGWLLGQRVAGVLESVPVIGGLLP